MREAPRSALQTTFGVIGESASLQRRLSVPFGLLMQPLHSSPPLITQSDDINRNEDRVVRCAGCNGYLNPHVRFEARRTELTEVTY